MVRRVKVLIVESRMEGGNKNGGGLANSFQDTGGSFPIPAMRMLQESSAIAFPVPCFERARVMRWGSCEVMGER